jgi:hypothetical protein
VPREESIMSRYLAAVAALLTGCVTYEPLTGPDQPVAVTPAPVPAPAKSAYVKELEKFRAEVAEGKRKYPDRDKSAETLSMCDRLFPGRGSDGHRLCMLRGMDRYVDHMTPPLSERYVRRPEAGDEISTERHVHPLIPYSPPAGAPQ